MVAAWYNNIEGTLIDTLTAYYGHHQTISKWAHILPNSSSHIDLIYTNQPNLVVDQECKMDWPGTLHINLIVKKTYHFYTPHFEPIF